MAAASYPIRRIRPHRRGILMVEFVLAVCVIAGLAFVSFRVMNMSVPESRTIVTGRAVMTTGTEAITRNGAGVKTP